MKRVVTYELFRERYELEDNEQATADYQEYLDQKTLFAQLVDIQDAAFGAESEAEPKKGTTPKM